MKQTSEIRLFNSKKSALLDSEDQENMDPNIPQRTQRTNQSTIKKYSTNSGRHPWSGSNTAENPYSAVHENVETSCFNLGPQKVSALPQAQQVTAQHQLDSYIGQYNIQDALIYLEEFDDIDWVKNSQIVTILEQISKGPSDQLLTLDIAKLMSSKNYLLSKLLVKGLYNNAFKKRPYFGDAIDTILFEQMMQPSEFFSHQQNYAALAFYTHSQNLLQNEMILDCWELVKMRLFSSSRLSDDLEKTIQKICELLLRYCIEKPNNNRELFNQILDVGVRALQSRPNDIFFNKLIDFAFKNRQVYMAEKLFTFMTHDLGINPTIVTINTLIDQYFKNNQQEKAWNVFNSLKITYTQINADNFTYTTLINGLKSGRDGQMDLKKAFELFEEYKLNSNPDQIIYNCLLDACINAGDLNKAYSLLHEMKSLENITLDEITYNTLIKGCGRKKRLNDAIALFEEMKTMNINPNRISFNSLLDSCVKCNRMNIAWKYYEEMTKVFRIIPDNFTYSILVNGIKTNHSNREELLKAIQLLEEIQEDGSFKADEILYNSLIDACVKFNDINKSLSLFNEMKRKGVEPSSVTYGILIKAYGKQNDLSRAFKIFEEMTLNGIPVNDVTYGCLVDACVKNDRLDMALELTDQMKKNGVPLNTVLYTTLIKGFARTGRIDEALKSFATMKLHKRTYPNLITYNSLLDGLIKHSKISEAETLFDEMLQSDNTQPDLISFSTLLKGHCKLHDVKKLKDLVEHMIRLSVQPDESLLMLVIDVCLNQHQYQFGLEVFEQFCSHVPQQLPLLLGAIRLYSFNKNLQNAKPLLHRLLQQMDDNSAKNLFRPAFEKTIPILCNSATNAPELITLITEIVVKAYRKHNILPLDTSPLLILSNEHMLCELLTLPNINTQILEQLMPNLSVSNYKAVSAYLKAPQRNNKDSTLGEKFGNIVKNCASQEIQNEFVLREISQNITKISDQKPQKMNLKNSNQQQFSPQYQDENNKNNGNIPKQNHSQYENKKSRNSKNDLDDYIMPKKNSQQQWRPVKRY